LGPLGGAELEIHERPPSTLKNIDGKPPGPVGVPVPIRDLKGAL
jgi:hypothetical protein